MDVYGRVVGMIDIGKHQYLIKREFLTEVSVQARAISSKIV